MTMQAERSSRTSQQEVDLRPVAFDAQTIKSIQLASGWQRTTNCEMTHFVVGKSHSPISPTGSLKPALRYENEQGKTVVTPLSQILSYSQDEVSNQF